MGNTVSIAICNQAGCENKSAFRFTWPGEDEAGICPDHINKLLGITRAMGLHVQVIPIDESSFPGDPWPPKPDKAA